MLETETGFLKIKTKDAGGDGQRRHAGTQFFSRHMCKIRPGEHRHIKHRLKDIRTIQERTERRGCTKEWV